MNLEEKDNMPEVAAQTAAPIPAGPAPTTRTSTFSATDSCLVKDTVSIVYLRSFVLPEVRGQ